MPAARRSPSIRARSAGGVLIGLHLAPRHVVGRVRLDLIDMGADHVFMDNPRYDQLNAAPGVGDELDPVRPSGPTVRQGQRHLGIQAARQSRHESLGVGVGEDAGVEVQRLGPPPGPRRLLYAEPAQDIEFYR